MTGIEIVVAVVAIAASAASAATSIIGAQEAKEDASRAKKIELERAALETQQRDLERARNEAALAREARVRKGQIANNSAIQGTIRTSSFTGGTQGISSALQREIDFSSQTAQIAHQADVLKGQAISAAASSANTQATFQGISGVIGGVKGVSTTLADNPDIFKSKTYEPYPVG